MVDDKEKPKQDKQDGQAKKQPDVKDPDTPQPPKPKRGGSKPILKVSGIGRVDNNMKQTTFQTANPINQKNYYTDYLKKDDQIWFYRELAEQQKREKEMKRLEKEKKEESKVENSNVNIEQEEEAEEEPEVAGSKVIVIHPGSQNLRIGLASQAYPKSIPNVIAHKVRNSESGEPPSRQLNGEADDDSNGEQPMEGVEEYKTDETFETAHKLVQEDLVTRMKFYKRRILPNSSQTVANFNSRVEFERIPDHNDPHRVEWNDVESAKEYYTGDQATKIPPDSKPQYKLRWPIRYGIFNETDYSSAQEVLGDISLIFMDALEENLNISFKDYSDYNVMLLIPDLYDKAYVSNMISLILGMGFANVGILQESMGATFGAGISAACIIDIGSQKTSVACVEEGMVISDSRVSLRYGGDDITTAFVKMLLKSQFPYSSINLNRQYDRELANELKQSFCTTNDADVAVQLYSFYQRAPGQQTRKYQFKTFDETMCAPLGLFYPELFELENKISNRFRLFPQSIDIYEEGKRPNDPISDAQINLYHGTLASEGKSYIKVKEREQEIAQKEREKEKEKEQEKEKEKERAKELEKEKEKEKESDQSQKPEPQPQPHEIAGGGGGSNTNTTVADKDKEKDEVPMQIKAFNDIDHSTVPYVGLEHAVIESISNASQKSQGTKENVFYENLMIVGGGASKLTGFNNLLTDRIGMFAQRENGPKYGGEIAVMAIPREMDPEVITWKGGGVYSKLKIVNEVWINSREWDIFGSRCLQYKVLFLY